MLYYTRSVFYRQQVEQLASGTQVSMRNISQNNMRMIEIPIPPLDEQREIVQILNSFFEKKRKAAESTQLVMDEIDLIKKSILTRAFLGELGTNDSKEENIFA